MEILATGRGAAHRHGDELVDTAVVDNHRGRAIVGQAALLHARTGKWRARTDMQSGGGDDVAVERSQHHHGRADALPAIPQNRDQRLGIALRNRFAKTHNRRPLPAPAWVSWRRLLSSRRGEHRGTDRQLALHLAFSIAVIGDRYRAECRGQHCGQQQQKSHRDSGTQSHERLVTQPNA